jgi:hypothetical protein
MSVGRDGQGDVVVLHDGAVAVGNVRFGPKSYDFDSDEEEEPGDLPSADDAPSSAALGDGDDALTLSASARAIGASTAGNNGNLQASMLGASFADDEAEQIELGDSVSKPIWNDSDDGLFLLLFE